MNAQEIVLQNLKNVLKDSGFTLTSFATFCKENGLAVDKSMFSRLNNGSSLKFDKIDPIIAGIQLLPGYESFSFRDLIADPKNYGDKSELHAKLSPEKTFFNFQDLESSFAKMFVDLDQLGWVKVNTELQMKTLTDFAILAVKNSGAQVVKDEGESKQSNG